MKMWRLISKSEICKMQNDFEDLALVKERAPEYF